MKIQVLKIPPKNAVLVFPVREGERVNTHRFFKLLDRADQAYLSAFYKNSPTTADQYRRVLLPSKRDIIILGLPKRAQFTHRKSLLALRHIVSIARNEKTRHIALSASDYLAKNFTEGTELFSEILATQLEIANFEFTRYKTPSPEGWFFLDTVSVIFEKSSAGIQNALRRGAIIGEEINKARVLSNTPGGDMTPKKLAEAATKAGKQTGFKTTILDEKKIRALKMGGVIGVSKGSTERPKFIIMEYLHGKRNEKPVVLVGKGVTFDTGGLNLKPEQGIYEMHMDMSGGAAVIHAIAALARLKIKKNIIGLVPAVENMPSGSSYHPGDQLKTMSGKTIEVLNTDAEGRIILADALTYAKKYNPSLVIDIATLTGSAMSALGQRASAIFTTDQKLEKALRETGELTGDFVWPLPLWEEYEEEIKGTFGDFANSTKTRYGGAITAAVFLWQFIKSSNGTRDMGHGNKKRGAGTDKEIPWVHIDIAPRMTSIEGEFLAKGAAGAAIGLLTHFLRNF